MTSECTETCARGCDRGAGTNSEKKRGRESDFETSQGGKKVLAKRARSLYLYAERLGTLVGIRYKRFAKHG